MRQVIALAGVGNLGKYIFEELTANDRYDVVILSRKESQWLADREANVRRTDYSEESVLSILNATGCTTLISFLNAGDRYLDIHTAFLNACTRSRTCKRLIPSEWAGNVDDFPLLPRFYGETREPFRSLLRSSSGIEWTLFGGGWLMDYFLPYDRTYMPPIPDEFPVDPNNWRACIRGTGNELQCWTSARDIAKAVVELLAAPKWDPVTYVAGEWSTFNEAVKTMKSFRGKSMEVSYKSEEEITSFIKENIGKGHSRAMEIAMVEECMVAGVSACPREKTLLQREKYFSKVKFLNLKETLEKAQSGFL